MVRTAAGCESMKYTCPCCGYLGLAALPYAGASGTGLIRGLTAPYSKHFGFPSYEVCPCCGFEFGNDDDPGTSSPSTFEQYLSDWIADGARWFDSSQKPVDWSLTRQLHDASSTQPR
jgi:hypothetical protein